MGRLDMHIPRTRALESIGGRVRRKVRVTYHEVGHVSCLPIRVPVVAVGHGRPVLSILCGIHGDEALGLLASHELLRNLVRVKHLQGTVQVIAAANPFAQALSSRVGFRDFLDLNRVGAGLSGGVLTERLAATVFAQVNASSLVVDLHEFEMQTPPMAIFIPSGDEDRDLSAVRGIAAFGPRLVWVMNVGNPGEMKYGQSLIASLISGGVPSFAVEAWVGDGPDELANVFRGLWNVAQHLGMVEGKPVNNGQTLAVHRRTVTAETAGVWRPEVELLTDVDAGEVIGKLTSIDFQEEEIPYFAGWKGLLLQRMPPGLVHTGTGIYSIGEVDDVFTGQLRKAQP